jgi:predicted ArsR family transcriptional regulator
MRAADPRAAFAEAAREKGGRVIQRKNEKDQTINERPQFVYLATNSFDNSKAMLLEDARNVLEEIRDKQMLQCDVRADIQAMRIALEKIAKNMPRRRKRKAA